MNIREKVLKNSLSKDLSFRDAFLDGVFTVPGDGCIDYIPIFKELKKNNYKGWLVVEAEQDPKKANPFKYAKIGYSYLIKAINLKKNNHKKWINLKKNCRVRIESKFSLKAMLENYQNLIKK